MAKPENSLLRTARLLDLVPYLTTHQGVSISELASIFKTTVKEITDDLNTLWMCGLPGYTPLELIDLEFESGFVSIRNAQTLASPRALDRAEALSIYMGLDLLESELANTDSAIAQEISALKDRLKAILITAPKLDIAANLASDLRGKILRAIRQRAWLEITYHSAANDEVSRRKISPYELSQSESHEYLLAYCDKAKAIRNFRADRIIAVDQIADQEWPVDSLTENDNLISYSVHVSELTRIVRETLPGLTEPIQQLSGYSQNWISRTISSLGGVAELTEPAELRALIHARNAAALLNYEDIR
jgi:proteasome accessory factor C